MIRVDEWLAAIEKAEQEAAKALDGQADDRVTVMEFAAMTNLSRASAYRKLVVLVEGGRAEVTRKHQRTRRGWKPVIAYRLIQKAD